MKLVVQVTVILFVLGGLSFGLLSWLGSSGPATGPQVQTPVQQARALAESRGCVACHSLDGARGIGPSWQGSWGAQRRFTDGTIAVVDADYLREAMLAPAARVVESFDNIMLPTGFTDAEIALITDLIRSLQPGALQAE